MTRGLFMVELRVSDWEASVRWYSDVLGLEMVPPTEPGRFALFLGVVARRFFVEFAKPVADALAGIELAERIGDRILHRDLA